MAAAASDELIAATDLADLLVKRGMPFRECHGVVAGLVREAVESGRTLAELTDDELAAASGELDRPPSASCSRRARGWSRRSPRAAPRSRACASSSTLARAALACRGLTADRLYARSSCRSSRSRARSSAARSPRGLPRRHRRDRGLPRLRAGLPRLRRPDAAHDAAVRRAGHRLRLPLLRHPRAAQRRRRARGRRRRRAHPRARAARRASTACASAAGGRVRDDLCSGPGKLTQALGIGLALNETSLLDGPIRLGPPLAGSRRAARS